MLRNKFYKTVFGAILLHAVFIFNGAEANAQPQSQRQLHPGNEVTCSISQILNDPLLDSLIGIAVKNNKDILQLMARMDMAKENESIMKGALFPNISVGADWQRSRQSGAVTQNGEPAYSSDLSVGANVQWELDLFGNIRNKVKSKADLYKVSANNLKWAQISLAAQVATTYINLRTYQQQYLVHISNLESQQRVLEIVQARYNSGLVSKLDVLQASTVYLSTQAVVPMYEWYITQTINTIHNLLGDDVYTPDNSPLRDSLLTKIGGIPQPVGVENYMNIPMPQLLARPDIAAQEANVASYAALVDASKKEWLPQFYLNGSLGYSSGGFSKPFAQDKMRFSLNPGMSWTIFDGHILQESVKLSKSAWEEAVNAYEQAVIVAVREVDNTMLQYDAYDKQVQRYKMLADQGLEILQLSLDLYKKGLVDFQVVLDAQRSLLGYENSLTQAVGQKSAVAVKILKVSGVQ